MRRSPSDGFRIVGAVDHDAVAEVEGVFAHRAAFLARGRIGRRDRLAFFDERPVRLGPHGIDDLPYDAVLAARRAEPPHATPFLENFVRAGRGCGLADELSVAEEISLVRGDVDGDDRPRPRRLRRQPLGIHLSRQRCGEEGDGGDRR
jgi:hypothetical protein